MIPLRISFPSAATAMRSVTVSEASVPISASTSKRTMRSWAARGDVPHRSIQAIQTESSSEPVFFTAVAPPRARFWKKAPEAETSGAFIQPVLFTAFSLLPLLLRLPAPLSLCPVPPWNSTWRPWRRWRRCPPAVPLPSGW
ncbi:hypothetical protein SDC9_61904 [bioreactor metagenome]|uniref:Uncharacterized protein n=1 Tax=bioreactor metagenome TaxID=1076179 RepID=A0A644XMN8_9ZZZZ